MVAKIYVLKKNIEFFLHKCEQIKNNNRITQQGYDFGYKMKR